MQKLSKFGSSVRTSSVLLTISYWLVTISSFYLSFVPEKQITFLGLILGMFSFVFYCVAISLALFFTWRWMRNIYIAAEKLQLGFIGYRQGWAFWGWLAPIVSLWIPRRILDSCYEIFTKSLKKETTLDTRFWWNTFIFSGIAGWISFRLSLSGEDPYSALFDLVCTILLTLSLPSWLKVVESLSDIYEESLAQEVSNITSQTNQPSEAE